MMDQNVAALVPLVAWPFRLELGQNQMPGRSDYRFDQGQNRQFRAISYRSSRWHLERFEV